MIYERFQAYSYRGSLVWRLQIDPFKSDFYYASNRQICRDLPADALQVTLCRVRSAIVYRSTCQGCAALHQAAEWHSTVRRKVQLADSEKYFPHLVSNLVNRLIWENEENEKETPILLFEDHPSLLRTQTKGQFHILKSLILEEFQMPTDLVMQGQQQEQGQGQGAGELQQEEFDPLTLFVSVGIAYLGFLEDQEVSSLSFTSFVLSRDILTLLSGFS